MHVSIVQHGSSSVAARGGLLYSGTGSLLKHVANICYAKATFMLNVTGWALKRGQGTYICIHHAYWPLFSSHPMFSPTWKKLVGDYRHNSLINLIFIFSVPY